MYILSDTREGRLCNVNQTNAHSFTAGLAYEHSDGGRGGGGRKGWRERGGGG